MKMIIADLDGTLVSKKYMSESTKETIQWLQQQGYIFTFATGRHKDAVRPLVESLNIEYPVICTNGAFIYDFKTRTVLHQDTLDPFAIEEALKILDQSEADYLLYTTESIVSSKMAKQKLESKIGAFDSLVVEQCEWQPYIDLGLLKILVIEQDEIKFKNLRKSLETLKGVYVLSSQPTFIDIGNEIANKGRALEKLTSILGIALKDVLSIGDQENDLTMIEKAGVGVAMGDAEEILKEKADFVTKPFLEDGFVHAINTYIKNHK